MKFLHVLLIFLIFINVQTIYGLRSSLNTMDIANYKIVSNNTGHTILFTYYPFHRTDTYREQEVISYQLNPYDKLMRLNYRGTNLWGIAWQYADSQEKFFYGDSEELNTRTTYIIKPNGEIDFQG